MGVEPPRLFLADFLSFTLCHIPIKIISCINHFLFLSKKIEAKKKAVTMWIQLRLKKYPQMLIYADTKKALLKTRAFVVTNLP